MGKPIDVAGATVVDEVLVLDTDRSVTGQDGIGYETPEAAAADESFSGRLASQIFAGVAGIGHVYVASNQVVVGRPGGWDDTTAATAGKVVSRFFVFYRDA